MATANKLGCYIACMHVLDGALRAVTETPTLAEPGLVACSECAERGSGRVSNYESGKKICSMDSRR